MNNTKNHSKTGLITGLIILSLLMAGCGGDFNNTTPSSPEGEIEAARQMAEELDKMDVFNEEITLDVLAVEGIVNGFAVVENGQVNVHLLYPQGADISYTHNIDREIINMIKEKYPDKTVNNVGGTFAKE